MYEDSSSWCISLICEFRMFNGHMPCIPAKGSKAILRQNRSHSSTHAWGLALASSKKFNLLNIILWTRALQPWDGLMTWSGAFVRCSARRHGSSTPIELRITIVDVRAGVCDSIISLQMNLTYHEAYLRHDIYVYDCMNACIVKWNDFDMHACMHGMCMYIGWFHVCHSPSSAHLCCAWVQEFAICVLLITWMGFDLTQVVLG